jgi:hypothetical protein
MVTREAGRKGIEEMWDATGIWNEKEIIKCGSNI